MQPELDSETLKFADCVSSAPQVSAVTLEAADSAPNDNPNFDAENCVMPQADAVAATPALNNEFTPS